jgi:anti-sigma factor RsiW
MRNEELTRLSMKPELSPDDVARLEVYLAAHPGERAAWEEERALSRALHSLPDVPLSNNFTARVLQAADLEMSREQRRERKRFRWLRAFWPRLAWTSAAVVLAVFGVHQFRTTQNRQLVKDIALVSQDVAKLPTAEVLRDFDTIESMRQLSASSDDELFLALQ